MPGKCKFQDAWLEKEIYKDWLMRDVHDIHSARCRACCRFIKLQTMGEAALTSHAGGAGHKVAVRKLLEAQALYRPQSSQSIMTPPKEEGSIQQYLPCESSFLSIDAAGQVNGVMAQVKGTFWPEEDRQRAGHSQVNVVKSEDVKDPPSESFEWSEANHDKDSTSHNPELQDPAFTTTFITATGCTTKRPSRRGRPPSKPDISDLGSGAVLSHLEQQRYMTLIEWEGRMKNLSQEQELLAEKRRATRQKERAYRLKKKYYRAKLRRLGEDMPSSSESEQDEGPSLSST